MMGEDIRFHSENSKNCRFVFLRKAAIYSAGTTAFCHPSRPLAAIISMWRSRGVGVPAAETSLTTAVARGGMDHGGRGSPIGNGLVDRIAVIRAVRQEAIGAAI